MAADCLSVSSSPGVRRLSRNDFFPSGILAPDLSFGGHIFQHLLIIFFFLTDARKESFQTQQIQSAVAWVKHGPRASPALGLEN